MSGAVRFGGRVLFLSADPAKIERQLAGETLSLAEAQPLRDQVSTDEITPARACFHWDRRLAEYLYTGVRCGAAFPFAPGSALAGGFAVSVAGKRRGKGSSREHSPYAERLAGIRLVVGESIERIYRQNCHNLGIFTSSDLTVADRVRRGEAIPIAELVHGLDEITRDVLLAGGLAAYGRKRLSGEAQATLPRHPPGPMTLAEKLIARAVVSDPRDGRLGVGRVRPGDAVFVRPHWRYSYEYTTPMAAAFLEAAWGTAPALESPETVLCFADHLAFAGSTMVERKRQRGLPDAALALVRAQETFCARHGVRLHGRLADREGSEGICHSIMAERYVRPGQVVVGTDSHTPHSGALGALCFGVGASDIANAWATGEVRITVPPTCRIVLKGRLPAGIAAKDLALHLLRLPYVRDGGAIGQVIEYAGEAIVVLNTDERATLTNMSAEIGGFTGIVAPDSETVRFIRERRGETAITEPWMRSDPEAAVVHEIEVDCDRVEAMLAAPGDPGNGLAVSELERPVPIDIAYGGSCTGAKREDLARYHEVLAWGLAHGRRVAPGVRFYLQFGSQEVRQFCERQRMIETFHRAGVMLLEPGCGACINAGPGASARPEEVTISAINRNFPGRSGPGQVWLASPATVAASALAGRIVGFQALRGGRG